jgi:mevalonate kinase
LIEEKIDKYLLTEGKFKDDEINMLDYLQNIDDYSDECKEAIANGDYKELIKILSGIESDVKKLIVLTKKALR